ncbi:hypothetical protein AAG747_26800 [Rapidithrix thailandica]|uniref:Uncharacterized protein n=1 Tax=Rapidithrix thailandica TaxID=413964 RepID=A0AAW9SGV2_9BACT
MDFFEIGIGNLSCDIKNYKPKGTLVRSYMDIYSCIRLLGQENRLCSGVVFTPESYQHFVPWLISGPICFVNKKRIFSTDYAFEAIEKVINSFFSKIRIGSSMDELLLKCNILFPFDTQGGDMKAVLNEDLPCLTYKVTLVQAVLGCPFSYEKETVNLERFVPEVADDFDLYVTLAIDFEGNDRELVHLTISTPKRLSKRYKDFFEQSGERASVIYGNMMVSEYNYSEIITNINEFFEGNEFFKSITGNSKTEILLKIAASMDVMDLERHLGEVLTDTGEVFTLLNGKVNDNLIG